jgi:hypothetical protein
MVKDKLIEAQAKRGSRKCEGTGYTWFKKNSTNENMVSLVSHYSHYMKIMLQLLQIFWYEKYHVFE